MTEITKSSQDDWKKIIIESNLFDTDFYLEENPDVKNSAIGPIEHYLRFGADEGRNPNKDFETNFYLQSNKDVAEAGINPFIHYILHGKEEGRIPNANIPYDVIDESISNKLTYEHRVKKLQKVAKNIARSEVVKLQQQRNLEWYTLFTQDMEVSNDWYEQLFSLKGEEKFCADFSNLHCLMSQQGWSNVRKVSKNIKVIYTVRDPFKRLWSHYKFHQKFSGKESQTLEVTTKQFEKLLDKEFFWRNAQYAENYQKLKDNLNYYLTILK